MLEPRQYNIATLLDMAKIPEDRLPAFLAELPRILGEIRKAMTFANSLHGSAAIVAKELIWVDDGIADGSADQTTIEMQLSSTTPKTNA